MVYDVYECVLARVLQNDSEIKKLQALKQLVDTCSMDDDFGLEFQMNSMRTRTTTQPHRSILSNLEGKENAQDSRVGEREGERTRTQIGFSCYTKA